jgi:hypothetical protein
MRNRSDGVKLRTWLYIVAILVLSAALAVAWYVYIPDAPRTEHGHVGR